MIQVLLQESLSAETIEILPAAENVSDVVRRLSQRVAGLTGLNADRIEQAVLDRERTRSTAFSNGAALPHCRLPELSRFVTGLAVLRKALRWDAEGHAVDTVLLIAGPVAAVSDHLRILANGSQVLDSPSVHSKLRTAPDAASACELVVAAEEAIEHRRSNMGVLPEVRRDAKDEDRDYLRAVAEKFSW